jgi:uncharacterized protein DUF4236
MPLRLWRRFRIVPGLRVNLSKGDLSLSVGRRGAWFTTGARGSTLGALGSGPFLTQQRVLANPPLRPLAHALKYRLRWRNRR